MNAPKGFPNLQTHKEPDIKRGIIINGVWRPTTNTEIRDLREYQTTVSEYETKEIRLAEFSKNFSLELDLTPFTDSCIPYNNEKERGNMIQENEFITLLRSFKDYYNSTMFFFRTKKGSQKPLEPFLDSIDGLVQRFKEDLFSNDYAISSTLNYIAKQGSLHSGTGLLLMQPHELIKKKELVSTSLDVDEQVNNIYIDGFRMAKNYDSTLERSVKQIFQVNGQPGAQILILNDNPTIQYNPLMGKQNVLELAHDPIIKEAQGYYLFMHSDPNRVTLMDKTPESEIYSFSLREPISEEVKKEIMSTPLSTGDIWRDKIEANKHLFKPYQGAFRATYDSEHIIPGLEFTKD